MQTISDIRYSAMFTLFMIVLLSLLATLFASTESYHHSSAQTLDVDKAGCVADSTAPTIDAKQVVLTAAFGADYPTRLGFFYESFIRNMPDAEMHIIIDDAYDIVQRGPPRKHSRIFYHSIALQGDFPWEMSALKKRMYAFACLCAKLPSDAGVLIVDGRDVLFQKSIFEELSSWNNTVHLFQEPSLTMIGDNINLDWLNMCYGVEIGERYKGRFIMNSGSIFGSVSTMTPLLLALVDDLNAINCDIDQAMLAHLLYSNHLGLKGIKHVVHSHEFGPVFTGNDATKTGYHLRGCHLFNLASKMYSVVHQYDRIPEINEALTKCHAHKSRRRVV